MESSTAHTATAASRLHATGRARQPIADYVELTKPKVQSLLLLTTITDMYVAGRPLAAAGRAHLPRRLPLRGRGGRGQPLVRPRYRRADGAHRQPSHPRGPISPRAALTFGCLLAALSLAGALADRQPARRGALLRRLPGLRVRLHGLAQAPHAAEHRHRRRRRRDPAARRLGRRARLAWAAWR